jgi:hypothetical protein
MKQVGSSSVLVTRVDAEVQPAIVTLSTCVVPLLLSQIARQPVIEAGQELLHHGADELEAPMGLGQLIDRGWMDGEPDRQAFAILSGRCGSSID